ncbi:MAG: sulfatase-like hydrolase/transferase [Planctomycetota bacterium]
MTTRNTKRLSASAWLVLLVALVPNKASADRRSQPNIVFIMASDLGWQDVGFMGADPTETPMIDELANQGMVFSSAYAGGPFNSATEACFLSGTYTPRHKIIDNSSAADGKTDYMRLLVPAVEHRHVKIIQAASRQLEIERSLSRKVVCIPDVLNEAGYQTARIGPWFRGRKTLGFDHSSIDGENGLKGTSAMKPVVVEKMTDLAIRFMKENRRSPFFLYISHPWVHQPKRMNYELVKANDTKLGFGQVKKTSTYIPYYPGTIDQVDESVGRILEAIDALGISESTLFIFTSSCGGYREVSKLAPLRGEKGSLFEAGVRVPMCMRWPDVIEANSKCDVPITSVDFLPTFASLARGQVPRRQPVDGINISPLMRGEEIPERSIFWHYPLYAQGTGLEIDLPDGGTYSWCGFPSSSVLRGHWKLIEFHEDNSVMLFNLRDDPGETQDLSTVYPDRTEELRKQLDDWQATTKAPIPTVKNPRCVLP